MTAHVIRWLGLALLPVAAWAQSTIDFRGVPLGASEAEFRAQLRGFHCRPVPAGVDVVADRICLPEDYPEERKFGGAQTSMLFAAFASDRMIAVSATFNEADFGKVRDALIEKFGAPISVDHPEFQTKGGLRAPNEVVLWRKGTNVVIARRYGASISESSVQYLDEADSAATAARVRDAARKNAKSL